MAERDVTIGDRRTRYGRRSVALAIGLIFLKILPVAVAFFGGAVLVVMIGSLTMREAYHALEPEVLILIGALTPLSEAVQQAALWHAGPAGAPALPGEAADCKIWDSWPQRTTVFVRSGRSAVDRAGGCKRKGLGRVRKGGFYKPHIQSWILGMRWGNSASSAEK